MTGTGTGHVRHCRAWRMMSSTDIWCLVLTYRLLCCFRYWQAYAALARYEMSGTELGYAPRWDSRLRFGHFTIDTATDMSAFPLPHFYSSFLLP
eukprot:3933844-Rhodomonas_salina.1